MISNYQIERELGRDNHLLIYLAKRLTPDNLMVELRVPAASIAERLPYPELDWILADWQNISTLQHENIIAVYETGNHSDQYFIASEYFPHTTIKPLLSQGPLPIAQALPIINQI